MGQYIFSLATNVGTPVKIISRRYGKHLTARMSSDKFGETYSWGKTIITTFRQLAAVRRMARIVTIEMESR